MTSPSLFSHVATDLPFQPDQQRFWHSYHGSSLAIALAESAAKSDAPIVLVTPDTATALRMEFELSYFAQPLGVDVQVFPDWETLPYDQFSPHQDIVSQRLATLYRLRQMKRGVVIVPINTLMLRIAPASYIDQHAIVLKSGDKLDMHALRTRLEASGYNPVQQVLEHGEFAARGSLLDLYPMGTNSPVRIDFFDDEVDSLRLFDPETQRSADRLDDLNLLPAHEFPLDDAGIERFRRAFRERFTISNEKDSIYQQVSRGIASAGIEYYLPLFFEQCGSLFDYLPESSVYTLYPAIQEAAEQFFGDVEARYEDRRYDPERPILPPSEVFLTPQDLMTRLKKTLRVQLCDAPTRRAGNIKINTKAIPDVRVNGQDPQPFKALQNVLNSNKQRIAFSVESDGRRESLLELLKPMKLHLKSFDSFDEFIASNDTEGLIVSPCEHSFALPEHNLLFITESELLGKRVMQKRRRDKQRSLGSDAVVRNLAELQIGQPVVHLDHGVGRYTGLQTLDAGGMTNEFVTLEYAGGDKLYVPVSALHLIGRYTGGDADSAPLNKLGNDTWEKAKRKAAEKVHDVAAELLDIYAQRAAKPGYKFTMDDSAYQQFAASFPFEETLDQEVAIENVIRDMRGDNAMDRLVCGDVGFGKTEVAMRAAFVAVNDGKQVSILVPTTLLAQQHYENIRDRFANWPVRVEVLSRFNSTKQTNAILADLEAGKVDIVVGTHKLLSADVKFKDLGLLIVDEEHRFGVRQKDKIKTLRANVDILTLTATPIPRTLNMAMSGMRDLSIIATPPARRLAVKTFVRPYDATLVREAVVREVLRGGQVYYLHNDVSTIEHTAETLSTLVPEARIAIAHGQMRERELEEVMSDFYHQRFNILVCTTIIETGIDVPSANTIIMNRADKYGLAQLHQLRGRVGRSHHQAYAYLLTPPPKAMTKDAVKRLEAIEQLEDLGAGFALATHDLEIRGAGELLGDDQSGQITSIGFSLYMEMLEHAVEALKQGKQPSLDSLLGEQTEVELRVPALLPDTFIPDVNQRLSLYKRIASATTDDELNELQVELIDRFGLLPDASKNLFRISAFKLKAAKLGISKVEMGFKSGQLIFQQDTSVQPEKIIGLIQSQPAYYRMEGPNKLRILEGEPDPSSRMDIIESLLKALQ
ncbi:transcription-repair coupling factor [Echinimonas agarilytica]|uniref:Transcription-repair-coupling factor n=1 Tax=Echinimonas agarilytica TaxID=1215918 RepID=A0AA41W6G0_9GAMM|nr:transcription-repair coupling factor [Echinimonas agarilytica]MCM2679935.1 transcription-repair coupling factor [Echinimonas agarilytica]